MSDALYAILHTSKGEIELELFPNHAPKTVRNFVELAEGSREWQHPETGEKSTTPLYNGTIFHRVIDNFMIQGGDPQGDGRGGPGYEFEDEFHPGLVFDKKYLLAMANAGPGTNGSQFFITTTSPIPHLNRKHTIFGQVTRGSEVVDAIGTTKTDRRDRPVEDVVVEQVVIDRRQA